MHVAGEARAQARAIWRIGRCDPAPIHRRQPDVDPEAVTLAGQAERVHPRYFQVRG